MNVFVPLSALDGLTVAPLAVTDGSPDPTWVQLPCGTDWTYGRRPMMRLPLDAAAAAAAHRWIVLDRRKRIMWTPLGVLLAVAAAVLLWLPGPGSRLWLPLLLANLGLSTWTDRRLKKVAVAQQPELVGRLGVYLPAMSARAAQEWAGLNPAVRIVSARPRWRRFPPRVHLRAAGLCTIAAAGIWWVALRDAESSLAALVGFVLLLGAAAVSFVKALPGHFDSP